MDYRDTKLLLKPKFVYSQPGLQLLENTISEEYKSDIRKWAESLGISEIPISKLIQVFVSQGYASKHSSQRNLSNRCLSFEGDIILAYVVDIYLHSYLKDNINEPLSIYFEGLRKLRAAIVSNKTLNEVARNLDMSHFVLKDEQYISVTNKKSEADTIEALVGLIFEYFGFNKTAEFIIEKILPVAIDCVKKDFEYDAEHYIKGVDEMVMKKYNSEPIYRSNYGIYNELFSISVMINDREIARGFGNSFMEAKKDAANRAYFALKYEEEEEVPVDLEDLSVENVSP